MTSMILATGVRPSSNEAAEQSCFEEAKTKKLTYKLGVIFFGFNGSRQDLVNQTMMVLR